MNKNSLIVVTGSTGQLGSDFVELLNSKGYTNVIGVGKEQLDLTDSQATQTFFNHNPAEVIVHCAAWTAVDLAEDPEKYDEVYQINVTATKNLALVCKNNNAKMVYISTDYVFSGNKNTEYLSTDITSPINVYGRTKLLGELSVKDNLKQYFIVRTSWVFGKNGNNFVKTMINLAKTRDNISVVSDQIGSPTYTRDLAEFILCLLNTEDYGIYHGTNNGHCSWYEFATEIFKLTNLKIDVRPIKSVEYPQKATRPLYSVLGKITNGVSCQYKFPDWKDAVKRFIYNDLGYTTDRRNQ